jgi:hypothetical protein
LYYFIIKKPFFYYEKTAFSDPFSIKTVDLRPNYAKFPPKIDEIREISRLKRGNFEVFDHFLVFFFVDFGFFKNSSKFIFEDLFYIYNETLTFFFKKLTKKTPEFHIKKAEIPPFFYPAPLFFSLFSDPKPRFLLIKLPDLPDFSVLFSLFSAAEKFDIGILCFSRNFANWTAVFAKNHRKIGKNAPENGIFVDFSPENGENSTENGENGENGEFATENGEITTENSENSTENGENSTEIGEKWTEKCEKFSENAKKWAKFAAKSPKFRVFAFSDARFFFDGAMKNYDSAMKFGKNGGKIAKMAEKCAENARKIAENRQKFAEKMDNIEPPGMNFFFFFFFFVIFFFFFFFFIFLKIKIGGK